VSLRPEEIEEERAAKDRGHVNADKNVARGDTDKVIIVDVRGGELLLHEILLVDIVYLESASLSTISCVLE
jgi:hypothetical protein